MNENAVRGFGRAYCDALVDGRPQRLAPYLHDDVEWMVFGPVDLFPYFGPRRGREAVLEFCARMAADLRLTSCEREVAIGNDNDAASLIRFTAVHAASGRTLSLRMAQFAQFSEGKLERMTVLFDSFDAAEQMLGRPIDLGGDGADVCVL